MNPLERFDSIKKTHKKFIHSDHSEECNICWLVRRCEIMDECNERLYNPMECGHPGANYSPVGDSSNVPPVFEPKACLTCRAVEEAVKKVVYL